MSVKKEEACSSHAAAYLQSVHQQPAPLQDIRADEKPETHEKPQNRNIRQDVHLESDLELILEGRGRSLVHRL